jgi:hypothetical protein
MNTNTWVFKVLLYFDMFIGACIWRDSGVTISSYCGLSLRKKSPSLWAKLLGGALNKLQKGHCESAITHDIVRAQAAIVILHSQPLVL